MFWLLLLTIIVYATLGYVLIGGVSIFQVLTAAVAVAFGITLFSNQPIDRRTIVRLVVPFLVFLAACILSTVQSVSLDSSWNYIRNWIGSLLLAFLVAHLVRTPRQLERLLVLLMVITALGGMLAILQRYVSAGFSFVPYLVDSRDQYASYFAGGTLLARPAGFGKMNFELGKDMLVGVVPALAFLAVGRVHVKLASACLVLGSIAVAISVLRSSWLAAAAGALWVAAMHLWTLSDANRRRIVRRLAVAAVLGAVLISAAVLASLRASANRGSSTNLRVALSYAAAGMLNDSPVLGVGIGNFKHRYAEYYPDWLQLSEVDPRRDVPAHNVLLEILAGAGPIALIAYLLVQLGAIANCIEAFRLVRWRPDAPVIRAAAAGTGGTLVALFVEYLMHNHQFENHLWLMVGVSFAVRRLAAAGGPMTDSVPSDAAPGLEAVA